MSGALLQLDGVTFRYPGAERAALDGVSFAAAPGRLHWLAGPLGAGCTTLLMTAAGLAPRYTGGEVAGSVRLLGIDSQAPTAAAELAGRVAFVTAAPGLQLSGIAATVLEEVAFAPANLGWPVARIDTAGRTALRRLGVEHLAERDPGALSGGETQRVVLAAMLALSPEAWLLDEAGSALDPAGRRLLADLLVSECRRGALVVVASEDIEEMAPVADRLTVLGDGRVVADGPPRALLSGDGAWTLGIGSTGTAELARAAGAIASLEAFAAPYPLDVDEAVRKWRR